MKMVKVKGLALAGIAMTGMVAGVSASVPTAQANTIASIGNDARLTPLKVSPVGTGVAHAALVDPHVPIIVLGARLNGDCGAPGVLDSRLRTALGLALSHPMNPVIVSGGATQPGCPTEAEYMKSWLSKRGVNPSRIAVDNAAMSTVGNAANTAHRAGSLAGITRAGVIVSSPSHLPRALGNFSSANGNALWLAVPSTVD